MAQDRRTLSALAALLPAGTLGLSVSLAAADAKATAVADSNAKNPGSVAERLQSIRDSVSGALSEMPNGDEPFLKVDPEKRLAWWGNGWHNGWHNGGWGNGWHNGGWGNGGWGNGGSCRSSSAARGATVGTTGATAGTTGERRTTAVPASAPYRQHRGAAADGVLQHQLQLLLPARSQQQARAGAVDGDAPVHRAVRLGLDGAAAHRDLARRRAAGRAARLLSRGLRHHRAPAPADGRGRGTPSRPTAC